MKTVYVLSKKALRLDYIPEIESLIKHRRVIKETRQGMRLCAVDAAPDFEGHLFMRPHYDFFDTRAELMEAIASQANAHAAKLGELKNAAITLMCEAHDGLRAAQAKDN